VPTSIAEQKWKENVRIGGPDVYGWNAV